VSTCNKNSAAATAEEDAAQFLIDEAKRVFADAYRAVPVLVAGARRSH